MERQNSTTQPRTPDDQYNIMSGGGVRLTRDQWRGILRASELARRAFNGRGDALSGRPLEERA
jgi:hypothetical protein